MVKNFARSEFQTSFENQCGGARIPRNGERNPRYPLDDDAIQVGVLCGGKFGSEQRPFVLTFYPEGGLELEPGIFPPTDIEDMADGGWRVVALLLCRTIGCKFREPDETCGNCDYVEDPIWT